MDTSGMAFVIFDDNGNVEECHALDDHEHGMLSTFMDSNTTPYLFRIRDYYEESVYYDVSEVEPLMKEMCDAVERLEGTCFYGLSDEDRVKKGLNFCFEPDLEELKKRLLGELKNIITLLESAMAKNKGVAVLVD